MKELVILSAMAVFSIAASHSIGRAADGFAQYQVDAQQEEYHEMVRKALNE